jgi:hypothetical protein
MKACFQAIASRVRSLWRPAARFLSYLVKCAVSDRRPLVFGYKGKQVR